MRFTRHCFILAAAFCLTLPTIGLAAPDPFVRYVGDPSLTAPSAAAVTADELRAVDPSIAEAITEAVAQGQAKVAPQIIYLQAPAVAAESAPSTGGAILGVLSVIPGEVWGALLGIVATLLFSFWRGSTADKTRDVLLKLAEGAWFIAERSGGTGAEKLKAACDAFYKALTGAGLKLDPKAIALRDYTFEVKSAADKLERERIEAAARAKAAAEVAQKSGAGELLGEAAKA